MMLAMEWESIGLDWEYSSTFLLMIRGIVFFYIWQNFGYLRSKFVKFWFWGFQGKIFQFLSLKVVKSFDFWFPRSKVSSFPVKKLSEFWSKGQNWSKILIFGFSGQNFPVFKLKNGQNFG